MLRIKLLRNFTPKLSFPLKYDGETSLCHLKRGVLSNSFFNWLPYIRIIKHDNRIHQILGRRE